MFNNIHSRHSTRLWTKYVAFQQLRRKSNARILIFDDPVFTETRHKRARLNETRKPYEPIDTLLNSSVFEKLMDSVEAGIMKFIDDHSNSLPLWEPNADWGDYPETLARIRALKLPAVPFKDDALPDMLLAALEGDLDVPPERRLDPLAEIEKRVFKLMSGRNVCWDLLNASGSGKTRLLFEILVRHWAFYFVCVHNHDSQPYGSKDIDHAVDILDLSMGGTHHIGPEDIFVSHVVLETPEDTPPTMEALEKVMTQRSINKEIAEHVFKIVVLARALVFENFLICWQRVQSHKPMRTKSTIGRYQVAPRARAVHNELKGGLVNMTGAIRAWAFLQICPHLVLPGISDLFVRLVDVLQWVEPTAVTNAISAILTGLASTAKVTVGTVMIDEVQTLAGCWKTAFGPEEKLGQLPYDKAVDYVKRSRPVLKPLTMGIVAALMPKTKVLLAATKFDEFLIKDAIASGVFKFTGIPNRFTDFGDQGTVAELTRTLVHVFGREFLGRNLNVALWNEIKFWLTGRHRFLMTFIQFVLYCGPQSMANVLKNLLWKLTEYEPLDFKDRIYEMDFGPVLSPRELLRAKVDAEYKLYHAVEEIVYAWIFHNEFPILPLEQLELVTLGIGRIVPGNDPKGTDDRIYTTENMTAAALYNWLNDDQRDTSLRSLLNDDLSSVVAATRGYALENALVYLFWLKFAAGCRLDEVFDFVYLPPSWRGKKARLVDVCRKHSDCDAARLHDKKLSSRLAWKADRILDSAKWFRKGGLPNMRIPFLRPDNLAGPDIFFILRLDSGEEILICVQSKAWSGTHTDKSVLEEFFKLSPERFYGTTEPPKDEKAEKIINKRKENIKELLDKMLLPSDLDMSPLPEEDYTGQSEYDYVTGTPRYPVLRVFAAYEGSYKIQDTTPGTMGRYPLAILSNEFFRDAKALFPSLDEAAKAVGAAKAQETAKERLARQREAEEMEMYAAWAEEKAELEAEIARAAGID
ncbi:hypothetical protein AURDEDRAFT_167242 [Auricularia subglabra TFB-10046 SS5]|nr:hypothetical protein AURDEDRAFT_167242 [Auricularia subglabra TFB-10046 SS5]